MKNGKIVLVVLVAAWALLRGKAEAAPAVVKPLPLLIVKPIVTTVPPMTYEAAQTLAAQTEGVVRLSLDGTYSVISQEEALKLEFVGLEALFQPEPEPALVESLPPLPDLSGRPSSPVYEEVATQLGEGSFAIYDSSTGNYVQATMADFYNPAYL